MECAVPALWAVAARSTLVLLTHAMIRTDTSTVGSGPALAEHASHDVPLEIVAVVDSNTVTRSKRFGTIPIIGPEHIEGYRPDAVVITSFSGDEEIYKELEPLRKKGVAIRSI